MGREIDVGIKACEYNEYPCKIVIEGNSVRVLYDGKDVMLKTSLDETVLMEEVLKDNVEKRLEEIARDWIKKYLNKAVSKLRN